MAITRSASSTASSTLWVTKNTVFRVSDPQPGNFLLQPGTRLRIERGEWLVHQKNLRIVDQHARQCRPLPHPSRKLVRVPVLGAREPHHAERPIGQLANKRGRKTPLTRAVLHVLPQSQPREERILLEHDAAIGPGTVDRPAFEQHLTGAWLFKAGQHVEQAWSCRSRSVR